MRPAILLCAIGALTACSDGPDTFAYQSSFDHDTRGLVLHSEGDIGHAGMYGTNCPFETERGSVTGDYDLPDSDEEIQDHGISLLGPNTFVATIGDDVYRLDKTSGDYVLDDITLPSVDRVRIVDGGLLATVQTGESCEIVWTSGDVDPVPLPACPDQNSLVADPVTGAAIAAVGGEVLVADAAGLHHTGVAADIVAWDSAMGTVYAATRGNDELIAMDLGGEPLWTTVTAAPIDGIAAAGTIGRVAAMLDTGDGFGELNLYEGTDGVRIGGARTPDTADTLVFSANGAVVGVVLERRAHFFETDPRLR